MLLSLVPASVVLRMMVASAAGLTGPGVSGVVSGEAASEYDREDPRRNRRTEVRPMQRVHSGVAIADIRGGGSGGGDDLSHVSQVGRARLRLSSKEMPRSNLNLITPCGHRDPSSMQQLKRELSFPPREKKNGPSLFASAF